ncbi:MAG: hypothetical protein Q4D06_05730 [Coriobacteriia bacterium]|nr:hypothetical protein [Coriobacteriia bacterium]
MSAGKAGKAAAGKAGARPPFVALSHGSALAAWRSGELGHDPAAFAPVKPGQTPTLHVTRAWAEDLARRFRLTLPLEASAWTPKARRNSALLRCHIHNPRLPYAYVRVGDELAVAAPELVLLQLAHELTVVELTLLASELFGWYFLDSGCEGGFVGRDRVLGRREVLLDLQKSASHVKGLRTLSYAVRYMVCDSRSPMETILALLLCLPAELGGYGLEKPVMNPRIDVLVEAEPGKAASWGSRYGDLAWEDAKLIVEYDSKANHDDYARDTSRANLLMANGWTVITALPGDVLDAKRCDQLAANIAAVLGKRPKSVPINYGALRQQLRADLFTASGTRCSENRNWQSSE